MEKFRVVRAPALARILAALSLGGLNDVLNNEGIGFDRLVADYRLDDDILTVSGARTSGGALGLRSEEHTSELQSLMRISYAVFCLKKKKITQIKTRQTK